MSQCKYVRVGCVLRRLGNAPRHRIPTLCQCSFFIEPVPSTRSMLSLPGYKDNTSIHPLPSRKRGGFTHPHIHQDNKRSMSPSVQKHPATFQCTLCPKRFTRAFTLRNHLRTTHTDDRPFVCTVCGKAFGRQHDRKTHEALHSGEKHFICRGDLESGTQWGCGKRFARATSLARHFRSERGRVCIRPLLEEERENQRRSNIPQEVANEQAEPTRREQLEAYDTFLASDTFRPAPSLSNLCSMLDGPIPTRFLIRTEHDNAPTYLCLMLLMKTIMKEKGVYY